MALLTGLDLARLLIEAMGLQHQRVKRIEIDAEVGCIALVRVTHFVEKEQGDAVAHALRTARLRIEQEQPPGEGRSDG